MIGPHAEPFDLRFTLPDGSTAPSAHLIWSPTILIN